MRRKSDILEEITDSKIATACGLYLKANDLPYYVVSDLAHALIAGACFVSPEKHKEAEEAAQAYIENKCNGSIYTSGDVEKAFKAGAKIMATVKNAEIQQKKIEIKLDRAEWQKMAKLICACEQLMEMADNFNQEAEKLLNKKNIMGHKIKSEWGWIAKKFRNIKSLLKKTYEGFTDEEFIEWGDEGERLEDAVREIMKIDIYEEPILNN